MLLRRLLPSIRLQIVTLPSTARETLARLRYFSSSRALEQHPRGSTRRADPRAEVLERFYRARFGGVAVTPEKANCLALALSSAQPGEA